jgi:hypothetical protein
LAILLEIVPSAMRLSSSASCDASTGESAMSTPSRFRVEATSPISQLAAALAFSLPALATTASK